MSAGSRYPIHRQGCRISHDGPCPTEAEVARMDAHDALDTALDDPADPITAANVEVAGKLLDDYRAAAMARSGPLVLMWEDAQGFSLVLHAAAKCIATLTTSLTTARAEREALQGAARALIAVIDGPVLAPNRTRDFNAAVAALRALAPREEPGNG